MLAVQKLVARRAAAGAHAMPAPVAREIATLVHAFMTRWVRAAAARMTGKTLEARHLQAVCIDAPFVRDREHVLYVRSVHADALKTVTAALGTPARARGMASAALGTALVKGVRSSIGAKWHVAGAADAIVDDAVSLFGACRTVAELRAAIRADPDLSVLL